MDAASIQEINKVRLAMGMKPLPVPGASPPPEQAAPRKNNDDDGEPVSTLETREAAAYDNFRKVQEAEEAKRRREEKAAAIKKARELAQRSATVAGKGLAEDGDDDLDAKSWLKNQKKRQKKIEAARKAEEEKAAAEAARAAAAEHTAADLAGVRVAHDMASFLDGDDQVLTLKDTGVLENEDEGDELENLALREQEKLQEKLDLKKKKPVYDPNDIDETGEIGILSKYDEEIEGKKKKAFTLDTAGTTTELADILDAPVQRKKHQVDLDALGQSGPHASRVELVLTGGIEDAPAPASDYLDPSEIKVKKPKKKKSKSTRQRRVEDDDDVLFPEDMAAGDDAVQEMDIDSGPAVLTKKRKVVDDNFVDDEDLQSSLALQRRDALKKRKKTRPEDIARQLREEAANTPETEADGEDKGMVMDEISRFVDALSAEPKEERPARKPKAETAAVTNMQDESSEDEEMHDADSAGRGERGITPLAEVPVTGVEEEKTVDQGMGATLALLRDRNLIDEGKGAELAEKHQQRQRFLNELHRRMAIFDQETRLQRERDRASGRLDRMSTREREEWQRQQNTLRDQHQSRVMDQLFREGYKPNVELRYFDGDGRSLDAKEAFKELSHQFHGKGSGKGKTDKKLKKLAEEKRRMAQSMLDASQNVGMSTAASHQGKKRREAGVRLA
ncbi:SART-1 family protein DOT2 [Madurella mycetomatis]|uniref:SART-1 family protein DOT2 n=1 Tax=Madurella mycetomatis TaxID=100816 RepID=A0A175WAH5_9PEZI|nr:SART-1 family protein DOT2 [Madurella mycetomatis]